MDKRNEKESKKGKVTKKVQSNLTAFGGKGQPNPSSLAALRRNSPRTSSVSLQTAARVSSPIASNGMQASSTSDKQVSNSSKNSSRLAVSPPGVAAIDKENDLSAISKKKHIPNNKNGSSSKQASASIAANKKVSGKKGSSSKQASASIATNEKASGKTGSSGKKTLASIATNKKASGKRTADVADVFKRASNTSSKKAPNKKTAYVADLFKRVSNTSKKVPNKKTADVADLFKHASKTSSKKAANKNTANFGPSGKARSSIKLSPLGAPARPAAYSPLPETANGKAKNIANIFKKRHSTDRFNDSKCSRSNKAKDDPMEVERPRPRQQREDGKAN